MAWHFNNLTTLTGSEQRATLNLSAIINPNDPGIHGPTRHVFFQRRNVDRTADHHIHEFWWDGNWHHDDLTDNAHAPLAAEDFLSSYMFKGTGTKHVIYQGFDEDQGGTGRIHELWWDGDWHHNDLTSAAGNAPLLTRGAPFGYEYSFFDTIHRRNIISQRVVYLTLDERKLHLLHWVANDGWHQMPLPDVPGFLSPPTAYVFSVQGQAIQGQASQRVLFLSPSMVPDIQHVHELTWNRKGSEP